MKEDNLNNEYSAQECKVCLTYRKLRPAYVGFTHYLHEQISSMLRNHQIDVHSIEARTKDVISFHDKHKVIKCPAPEDSLRIMSDLSGVRVICRYYDDLPSVCRVLEKKLGATPQQQLEDPQQFGYASIHYGVHGCNEKQVQSSQGTPVLTGEVQVRTILQHAWATVSHEIDYKPAIELANEERRILFRIAALLETADKEFSTVCHAYQRKLAKSYPRGVTHHVQTVKCSNVQAFLAYSPVVSNLLELANKHYGFSTQMSETSSEVSDLSNLQLIAEYTDIRTIAALEDFITSSASWAEALLRRLGSLCNMEGVSFSLSPSLLTAILIVCAYINLYYPLVAERTGWGVQFAQHVIRAEEDVPYNPT